MFSFFWILLATAVYGIFHSLTASLFVKALAEKWLGLFAHRFYRLFFNLFSFISLLFLLVLVIWLPDRQLYRIPVPWFWAALVLQAAAVVCALIALRQTGVWALLGLEQMVSVNGSSRPPALSVQGFYRWMRHPVYSFSLLFIWLTPIMSLNLLALFIGFTSYILIGIYFEEKKLLVEFGEDYARYRRQTAMLIPPFL
ncbi:MAG: hypothetical protein LWX83_00755 [Anaerolineae bacterium]|nr:hypothetical protein [Anaerolineae bacterium]